MILRLFAWVRLFRFKGAWHRSVYQHPVSELLEINYYILMFLWQIDTSYDHKVATIASWILDEAGNSSSHFTCQPRKIELPIIQTIECSRNLIESQGCVGVIGSRNVICKVIALLIQKISFNWGFCLVFQDDAGSAVLYSTAAGYYELIGILSDRQTCRKSETFTASDYELPMYTKVDSFMNWILANTKDACYCNKI